MDLIKDKSRSGLASIDEDAEQSMKSVDSPKKGPGKALMGSGSQSMISPGGHAASHGALAVDNEFKEETTKQFREITDGMEELKEELTDLKTEIGAVRNDV